MYKCNTKSLTFAVLISGSSLLDLVVLHLIHGGCWWGTQQPGGTKNVTVFTMILFRTLCYLHDIIPRNCHILSPVVDITMTCLHTQYKITLLVCFSWFALGPNEGKSSWDNSVFPTLWQQFVFVPFLFQHDNGPLHKASSIKKWFSLDLTGLHRALTSTPSNTDCEPDLITQHQCWTALIPLSDDRCVCRSIQCVLYPLWTYSHETAVTLLAVLAETRTLHW